MEIKVIAECIIYPKRMPELALLAGVLERAFRDLNETVAQHERRGAIAWFKGCDKDTEFPEFTFKEIVSYLGLSVKQINYILSKVDEAEKRDQNEKDKLKEKRLTCGIGASPLAQRERNSFSTAHAAI